MLEETSKRQVHLAAESMASEFLSQLRPQLRATARLASDVKQAEAGSALDAAIAMYDQALSQTPELGWVLGVLSAALDANVLQGRRNRRGLELIARGLQPDRSMGHRLDQLPSLTSDAGQGWEAAFLWGWLWQQAELSVPPGARVWQLRQEASHWELSLPINAAARPKQMQLGQAWARITSAGSGSLCQGSLRIPKSWLAEKQT
jgi:hypothetical protein